MQTLLSLRNLSLPALMKFDKSQKQFSSEKVSKSDRKINCNPDVLSQVLVQQWKRLTPREIEKTGYLKHNIALLIERKYGIPNMLTENYLSNLERTLPKQ